MVIVQETTVVYHSREWDWLVEAGWVTLAVDGNLARMIRETHVKEAN